MAKKKKDNWIKKLLKTVIVAYLLLTLFQLASDIYSRVGTTHEITVSEEWNLRFRAGILGYLYPR